MGTPGMINIIEDIISKNGFLSTEKKKFSIDRFYSFELNGKEFSKKETVEVDGFKLQTKEEYQSIIDIIFVGEGWITYFNKEGLRGDIEIPFFSSFFTKKGKIYRKLMKLNILS